MSHYSKKGFTEKQLEIRQLCESDLKAFVGLVAPYRMLGHCHLDLMDFFMQEGNQQLVLWPRGHQKSTIIAYWCAWYLITNPSATIIYASATLDLAEKQLTFIKNVLESDMVMKYWPELLNRDAGQRGLWRMTEFNVDHPSRKDLGIRDPSVKAVGMGGNITGFHADAIILDDIVVYDNSNSKIEREKCKSWYSLLTSILNPGGIIKAVGTRYHPEDLYNDLINMNDDVWDDDGEVVDKTPVYIVSQKQVEDEGQYLWPKQKRNDGKFFGFDKRELSKIRSQYLDKAQYYAQYYNNPTDPENKKVEKFNYYDREKLRVEYGKDWFLGESKLNVFAAIDFASTVTKKSDYTCIVVIGVDKEHNIFVLDIDRFKTDKISVMAEHLTLLYDKWRWIKLRGEATAAQNLVVNEIKAYNSKNGIYYNIDIHKPTTEKNIRIMANLEPRYAESKIYHFRGGMCEILEQELMSSRPPHDDVSDSLASAVEIAIAPMRRSERKSVANGNVIYHPKFGGVY